MDNADIRSARRLIFGVIIQLKATATVNNYQSLQQHFILTLWGEM